MKNSSIIKAGIVAFLLSLLLPNGLQAQTLVLPSNTDNVWYTPGSSGGSYIFGLNAAMIDYSNALYGTGTLMVSDYYGNGTAGGVVFTDETSGFQIQMPYNVAPVADYYIFRNPDIIVGNDATNPYSDYNVAVAYICLNTATSTIQPQVDYWHVHYPNAGHFTVKYICSTLFNFGDGVIHIDGIAEAGNTSATNLPWCDKFIVTFDCSSDLNAFFGSLNSPVCGTATPTTIVSGGGQPDVAAIQRKVGSSIDDIGLITYTDAGGLEYIEWDVTAPSISLVTNLDLGTTVQFISPRIDAPDDYTINAPSPLYSYYKVVVEAVSGSATYSYSYDNVTYYLGFGAFNTYPGGTNEYFPTVAFGGGNNTQYQVAHASDDGSITSPPYPTAYPDWNTFMEPIDWTNPYAIATAPFPSSALDYFLVNNTPFNSLYDLYNDGYTTAISTPCNNPADQTLVAWTYLNNSLGSNATVWYKTTPYGGSNGYAFRQAAPTAVNNVTAKSWAIYPNPATTVLTVDNPLMAATYQIIDMPGRTLLSGSLAAGTQTIDVSCLSPGSYIISLYEENKRSYTQVFVKQ